MSTVTADEFIISHLVIGNCPSADMAETIATLRVLRANVALVADLHGVTMDEQVGSNRAAAIAQEAVALIQAGRSR